MEQPIDLCRGGFVFHNDPQQSDPFLLHFVTIPFSSDAAGYAVSSIQDISFSFALPVKAPSNLHRQIGYKYILYFTFCKFKICFL
jgi:hypothetical protein